MTPPEEPDGLDRREADTTEVVEMHAPIYREMAEPRDGYEPVPLWLMFFCFALTGFGGWYLGNFSGGFDPNAYDETAGARGAATVAATPTPVDPMVLGKRVYNNCMACHQADGAGVAGNYPPLDGSSWATGRPDVFAALLLHGLEGPIEVKGVTYDNVMPPWDHLSDEQLAAVMTFVRRSWSNRASEVSPGLVAAVRERVGDRRNPWRVAELEELEATTAPPEVEVAEGAAADADGGVRSGEEPAAE